MSQPPGIAVPNGPTGTGSIGTGTIAPSAPGRMGEPVDPSAASVYLDSLGRWRDDRRRELDQLDQAALASPNSAAATSDILLSMALWKAASDRYELLAATWNGGRVGPTERVKLANLIWGRLDSAQLAAAQGTSGVAVSLPEACRLSDALAAQLRVRLGLELSGLEVTERLRQLRAQMERIRDQIDLEPAGTAQQNAAVEQSRLARRLKELADKAGRGGDVTGLLGPLEIDAATFERDLIVGAARRREAGLLVGRARQQRAALAAREASLRALAADCVRRVEPAPKYAVPSVDALGALPNTPDALQVYLTRLDQVGRAMDLAETAYGGALKELDELTSLLDAYAAKAAATGVADVPEVARAYGIARETLAQLPCRMVLARQLVTLYQTYLTTTRRPPEATR